MKLNKKFWIILASSILAVAVVIVTTVVLTVKNSIMKELKHELVVGVEQIDDTQKIKVNWESDKMIDSVEIEILHNQECVAKYYINDTTTLLKGFVEVDVFYGKHQVKVTSSNSYKKHTSTTTICKSVNLTADEYVIAPITATMPVTLFTLSLEEITDNYTIPTFVWFKRPGVWDYSEMPNNVNLIPVCSADDFIHDTSQNGVYDKVALWVKELYELNPQSKFNFYFNDYYPHGWLLATVGNNIPVENYKITLLSDGAGSFLYFNNNFNNDNYQETYLEMKLKYETFKTEIENDWCNYSLNDDKYSIAIEEIRNYIYVMIKEETNIDWWLTRVSGTLAPDNTTLYSEIEALVDEEVIKVKNMATMLSTFDEEEKTDLKKLYKFNDNMFEAAVKAGKDVMLFLGTWNSDEINFSDYVKLLKVLYGDNYVYYYKGHPKSPTELIEGKFDKLDELDIIDVDSTIPAELIFFFNPEIYASGYQTSTFYSIEAEKCKTIFHIRKNELTEAYDENMENFVTKVDVVDAVYGSLVWSNNCYLIEYNGVSNYDFAICDVQTGIIKYYKNYGATFEEIDV